MNGIDNSYSPPPHPIPNQTGYNLQYSLTYSRKTEYNLFSYWKQGISAKKKKNNKIKEKKS